MDGWATGPETSESRLVRRSCLSLLYEGALRLSFAASALILLGLLWQAGPAAIVPAAVFVLSWAGIWDLEHRR